VSVAKRHPEPHPRVGVRSLGAPGQATVEAVAMLPLLVAIGGLLLCVLAAGRAREAATHAAEAGAVALLRGGDAARAARAAVPGLKAGELTISVRGHRVSVRVTPRLPVHALERRLEAHAVADAGEVR
jgi:hypothetical protein